MSPRLQVEVEVEYSLTAMGSRRQLDVRSEIDHIVASACTGVGGGRGIVSSWPVVAEATGSMQGEMPPAP